MLVVYTLYDLVLKYPKPFIIYLEQDYYYPTKQGFYITYRAVWYLVD